MPPYEAGVSRRSYRILHTPLFIESRFGEIPEIIGSVDHRVAVFGRTDQNLSFQDFKVVLAVALRDRIRSQDVSCPAIDLRKLRLNRRQIESRLEFEMRDRLELFDKRSIFLEYRAPLLEKAFSPDLTLGLHQ
jgi:hypothetical protein